MVKQDMGHGKIALNHVVEFSVTIEAFLLGVIAIVESFKIVVRHYNNGGDKRVPRAQE